MGMLSRLFNKKNSIEKFWQWFATNEKQLFRFEDENQELLFMKLHQQLQKVHPSLAFEFSGMLKNKKRYFVISADGNRDAFPSVLALCQAAPLLPHWIIIPFRQPKPGFTGVDFGPVNLQFKDIFFRYAIEKDKLSVEMNIRNYDGTSVMDSALFIALDTLIGEYATETYLGSIERKPLVEKDANHLYPVTALPSIVESFKNDKGIEEKWKLN
jgi:hypothetical protein